MSALSNCLNEIVSLHYQGEQRAIAKATHLTESLISRYCSGRYRPNPDKLDKLCAALAPELRARLAAAHLHDECPPSARYEVHIEALQGEKLSLLEAGPPPAYVLLDAETRSAVDLLISMAVHNNDVRNSLLSTASFIRA